MTAGGKVNKAFGAVQAPLYTLAVPPVSCWEISGVSKISVKWVSSLC